MTTGTPVPKRSPAVPRYRRSEGGTPVPCAYKQGTGDRLTSEGTAS